MNPIQPPRRAPVSCKGGLLLLVCITLMFTQLFCATRKPRSVSGAPYDMDEFNRRYALALDLKRDDRVAWHSTDSIMAHKPLQLDSLDKEWFVCRRGDLRYAYYGRYDPPTGAYLPKYAFEADEHGALRAITPDVDEEITVCGRVVHTGKRHFERILDSIELEISFNHYLRKEPDGTWALWFFPAGYAGYSAYGLEVFLQIDAMGGSVITGTVNGKYPRYFELSDSLQTIELDNGEDTIPTLGSIFFTLSNRSKFKRIEIISKTAITTMVYSPQQKQWTWVFTRNE